ncbi:sin-like protein conserved region domain-containing protein [Ditylenchus destructor]|nr:sin-like protein conserved region domain-containing protein [Ditylenchus destructor]
MFHDSCARTRPFMSNKNLEAVGIDAHNIKNEPEWNTTATARSPEYAKPEASRLEIQENIFSQSDYNLESCARTRPFEPTRTDKTDKIDANDRYNSILSAHMPTHLSEMEACQGQSKFGIVVAPDFVNRLLFPTREQQIRSAKFKKNVKRLRLEIGQNLENYDDNMQDSDDEIITDYHGDGYMHPEMINTAAGFFKNGKLVLIPVHDTYEMHCSVTKPVSEGIQYLTEDVQEVFAPVHVKFKRAESKAKKMRREQSAWHALKLFNKEAWMDLKVEEKIPSVMYKDIFGKSESSQTEDEDYVTKYSPKSVF